MFLNKITSSLFIISFIFWFSNFSQAMLCDPKTNFNFDHRHKFMEYLNNAGNKELTKMFEAAFDLADREENFKQTKDFNNWLLSKSPWAKTLEKYKPNGTESSQACFEYLLSEINEEYKLPREELERQYSTLGRWNEWPLLAMLRLLQLTVSEVDYLEKALKENESMGKFFPGVYTLKLTRDDAQKYLTEMKDIGLVITSDLLYDPASTTKIFFDNYPYVRELVIAAGHIYELGSDKNNGKFVVNIDPLRAPDVTSDIYDENFLTSLPKGQFIKIYEDSNIPNLLTKDGSENSNLARTLYDTLKVGGELISIPKSFSRSKNNHILLEAGFIPIYVRLSDKKKDEKEKIFLETLNRNCVRLSELSDLDKEKDEEEKKLLEMMLEHNYFRLSDSDKKKDKKEKILLLLEQMRRQILDWKKMSPKEQLKVISELKPEYAKNLIIKTEGWYELDHFKKL